MAFKTIQLGTPGQVDALSACAGTTGLTKYIDDTFAITNGLIIYNDSGLTTPTYTSNPGGYSLIIDGSFKYAVTFDGSGVVSTVTTCESEASQTPTPTPTITNTPTTTPTPTTSCVCWSFQNAGGSIGNVSFVDCEIGATNVSIDVGATTYKCVTYGTTPSLNSGNIDITPLGTLCTTGSNCGNGGGGGTTSQTPTPTNTPTKTPTSTPTNTSTNTQTPTNTSTKTPTSTPTKSINASATPTSTITRTPTITPTKTVTRTATMTPPPTQIGPEICEDEFITILPLEVICEPTDATWSECNDGEIFLYIKGGTPPYKIYINGVLTTQNPIVGLRPGVYEIRVEDFYGDYIIILLCEVKCPSPNPTPTNTPSKGTRTPTPTKTPTRTPTPTRNDCVLMVLGTNNILLYSYSLYGDKWYKSKDPQVFTIEAYTAVSNGYGFWVAGGEGGSSPLAYSYDGISWLSSNASNIFNSKCNIVIHDGSKFIAGGDGPVGGRIATSVDGINWTLVDSDIFDGGDCFALSYNGTVYVAGGSGDLVTLAYSYNGTSWTEIANSGNLINYVSSIATNGSGFVAVGGNITDPENNTILTSDNGLVWKGQGIDKLGSGNSVVWTGLNWVAGGETGGSVNISHAISSDGVNWTTLETDTIINGLHWNNRRLFYGGEYYGPDPAIKFYMTAPQSSNYTDKSSLITAFGQKSVNFIASRYSLIPSYSEECITPTPPPASPPPTPSVTPSISVTPSVTPSISITPTVTPSISITPSNTPTISITPTITPTATTPPDECIVLLVTSETPDTFLSNPIYPKVYKFDVKTGRTVLYADLTNQVNDPKYGYDIAVNDTSIDDKYFWVYDLNGTTIYEYKIKSFFPNDYSFSRKIETPIKLGKGLASRTTKKLIAGGYQTDYNIYEIDITNNLATTTILFTLPDNSNVDGDIYYNRQNGVYYVVYNKFVSGSPGQVVPESYIGMFDPQKSGSNKLVRERKLPVTNVDTIFASDGKLYVMQDKLVYSVSWVTLEAKPTNVSAITILPVRGGAESDDCRAIPCPALVNSDEYGDYGFPIKFDVILNKLTDGKVKFSYNVPNKPTRFIIKISNQVFHDTGYVGASVYNYKTGTQTPERIEFTTALEGKVDPITGNVYGQPGSGFAPDNYPYVLAGTGSVEFIKTQAESIAVVEVYSPLEPSKWEFLLECPIQPSPTPTPTPTNTPSVGSGDPELTPTPTIDPNGCIPCNDKSILFPGQANYPTDLCFTVSGTGIVRLYFTSFTNPDRFIVYYENEVVSDTGFVGQSINEYDPITRRNVNGHGVGGSSRSNWTVGSSGLIGEIEPISGLRYPNSNARDVDSDNYPFVYQESYRPSQINGKDISFVNIYRGRDTTSTNGAQPAWQYEGYVDFDKQGTSSIVDVEVYGKFPATLWRVQLLCPRSHECDKLVNPNTTFNPYFSTYTIEGPRSEGIVKFFSRSFSTPVRFIVKSVNGAAVIDTGYIGKPIYDYKVGTQTAERNEFTKSLEGKLDPYLNVAYPIAYSSTNPMHIKIAPDGYPRVYSKNEFEEYYYKSNTSGIIAYVSVFDPLAKYDWDFIVYCPCLIDCFDSEPPTVDVSKTPTPTPSVTVTTGLPPTQTPTPTRTSLPNIPPISSFCVVIHLVDNGQIRYYDVETNTSIPIYTTNLPLYAIAMSNKFVWGIEIPVVGSGARIIELDIEKSIAQLTPVLRYINWPSQNGWFGSKVLCYKNATTLTGARTDNGVNGRSTIYDLNIAGSSVVETKLFILDGLATGLYCLSSGNYIVSFVDRINNIEYIGEYTPSGTNVKKYRLPGASRELVSSIFEYYGDIYVAYKDSSCYNYRKLNSELEPIQINSSICGFNMIDAANSESCRGSRPTSTPTPTVTPTISITPTNTPTVSITPTNTPTLSETPTNTPTISITPTNTPTLSETPTNTPTNTPTISITPTNTPTISITPTNTPTLSETPTNTPTISITPTKTLTVTPTNTKTKTPTPTRSGEAPLPPPPPGCQPCDIIVNFNGGVIYPSEPIKQGYCVIIGDGQIGKLVTLEADSYQLPDRYIVYVDGAVVIDTGYIGQFQFGGRGFLWNTIGAFSRGKFTESLFRKTDPITKKIYPFVDQSHLSDGYPRVLVNNAPSVYSFTKITRTNVAYVDVYGPMNYPNLVLPDGSVDNWVTKWEFNLKCPGLTPTPTPTRTQTPTATPTRSQTPTRTITNTPTKTQTPTTTKTPTVTPTLSSTPTNTPTNTNTITPTITPTLSSTPTNTPTNTNTPTPTPSRIPGEIVYGYNCPCNTLVVNGQYTSVALCRQICFPSNTPTSTITPTNTPSTTFIPIPTGG